MVKIDKFDGYSVLGSKVVFVSDENADIASNHTKKLVLSPMVGEDMTYDNEFGVVDYPGEYELQGISVRARADAKGLMNYIVGIGKQFVVIVQSTSFLDTENDLPEDVATWIFRDTSIKEYREKCEFEGDFIDLSVEESE